MYNFLVIDPRNPVVPSNTVGVEVTDPKVAAMCDLGNVDPQHGCDSGHFAAPDGYKPYRAAVHAATQCPLPASGATLATIRPDLDAVGAMAVLALRKAGHGVALAATDAVCRIESIVRADCFTTSGAWRPTPLPTAEQPWPAGPRPGPEQPASVDSTAELAAINAVCQDRNRPLVFRVACAAAWILGGDTPPQAVAEAAYVATHDGDHVYLGERIGEVLAASRAKVDAARLDMVAALSDGRIAAALAPCPKCGSGNRLHERGDAECSACGWDSPAVAVVRSSHPGATGIGYCLAPVVVAINADFRWPSGGQSKKHTIAFYAAPGVERMAALATALNREEAAVIGDAVDVGRFIREGAIHAALGWIDTLAAGQYDRRDLSLPAEQIADICARVRDLLSDRPSGGWGGNLTSGILGSPQGRASVIPDERIVELVRAA